RPDLSIALGAEDVTPLEMTSAYATLAAGGVYHPPQPIRKVVRNGVSIGDFTPKHRRVISDGVAAEVTKVLSDNILHGLPTTPPAQARGGGSPASRAPGTTRRPPGSAAPPQPPRGAGGGATSRPPCRCTTSRASARSPARRSRRRSGTATWTWPSRRSRRST